MRAGAVVLASLAATAGLVTCPRRMFTPSARAGLSLAARSTPLFANCST